MKLFCSRQNRPLWNLCWRLAGLAAAAWALYELIQRHHWLGL